MTPPIYNIDNAASEAFVSRLSEKLSEIESVMAPKSSGYEKSIAELLKCSDGNAESRARGGPNCRYYDIIDDEGSLYEVKKASGCIIFDAVRYAEIFLASRNISPPPGCDFDRDAAAKPSLTLLFVTNNRKKIKYAIVCKTIRLLDLLMMNEFDALYHLQRYRDLRQRGTWNSQVSINSKALLEYFNI